MKSVKNTLKDRFVKYIFAFLDKVGLSKSNACILMFHHVTDNPVKASKLCKCSVAHFEKVLNYLIINNINVVSLDEALINIKKGVMKGYAVITFDDAIDNTFEVAYPILKSFNFPFTVYITMNYLNKEGYLNTEQLKILNSESLCTLGSHTISHPVLRTALNAKEEIVQSKESLEKILNKEVLHFAYPYGGPAGVSLRNLFDTKNAGYVSAVSTVETRLNHFSVITKLFLPRINGSLVSS